MLKNDVFTHSNPLFVKMTEAENALIPKELHNTKKGKKLAEIAEKIRYRKIEHSYFVDESGKVIAYQKIGKLEGLITSENIAIIQQAKKNGHEISLIHNHPANSTLSSLDLGAFHVLELEHIMATTSSGGYASLSRGIPLNKIDNLDKQTIHNM